ncbi:hypothetical protein HDF24_09315 [Mucilaginibacter sp. X4EP1]|uniref:hypothetical protein n=1 Tax=Mucilaginibacter sp. X4EP1 TaxID=2723092 RepID=UPI00216764D0|nr:hypothetical protein [Mucilaginibacter sp. X4EP1]MCS3813872.1 hypothetical protein [Mucilaginibacter sp. X4EP1]
MKFFLTYSLFAIISLSLFNSCNKEPAAVAKLKASCLYNNKVNYFQKWSNTFTEIDIYTTSGAIQSQSFIYPYGYFQLNSDASYNVLSDNVPLKGTWTVSDSCQLILDPGTKIQRSFDVLKLSNDSLTIRRKAGDTVYTQHYIAYACPTAAQLEYQWNNVFTVEQNYNASTIFNTSYIYPVGYFKLNSDFSYNVVSDGVPLNGTWTIDTGCKLVLDKNTSLQRSFDIQQLTADSLTIWRKDTVNQINYLQHYKKN